MKKFYSKDEIIPAAIFIPLALMVMLGLAYILPRGDRNAAERLTEEYERGDSLHLRAFDPNTVTYEELRAMGVKKYVAVSLIRYRTAGKVFRIVEDVALCYGVDDSTYHELKPYITIDSAYQLHPRYGSDTTYAHREAFRDSMRRVRDARYDSLRGTWGRERREKPTLKLDTFRIDTVSARYLRATGVLTKRQAEALVRWRDLSGIYDMEELRACYVVSDSAAQMMEPYVIFPTPKRNLKEQPIDLNTADSAELRSVKGIGEKTVMRIIAYRERLGGFCKKEQLKEVEGMTEQNYELISQQISINCHAIRKLNLNLAPRDELARHPYLSPRILRKLLKQRQLKGGWKNFQELIDDRLLTHEEAERLAAYLDFGS